MKKICIITGTRAEWGLLSRLAALIRGEQCFELQIIATNMHLSERYGMTYKEIEADGFNIDYKIEMDNGGDSARDTVKSMAAGIDGFADAYEKLKPDTIVILGDRYEMLMAASAALIFRIPVAHLYGGDITVGAYDDAIRHAITKMSHIHFTATEKSRNRVIQMGENPTAVHYVGSIGVDNIANIELMEKAELEESIQFKINKQTIIVTYHPVTLEGGIQTQIDELLNALTALPQLRIIFTMPNSDTGNGVIVDKIKEWVDGNSHRSVWFTSCGMRRYLSALKYVGGVVGNSSSGVVEVPSFGIPTLNIGNRQKGRVAASSVINCNCIAKDIEQNITMMMGKDYSLVINPYQKADTARNIVNILKDAELCVEKNFYEI